MIDLEDLKTLVADERAGEPVRPSVAHPRPSS